MLRASGTPQRSEKRPRAQRRARTTNSRSPRAQLSTPRHSREAEALPARRGAAVNLPKPLARRRARAKPPFGLHEPAGPGRQGRAAGGVAARLPPPRPAPGLRETLASGAARRKSPQLLQLTRPSATPRPHPRPRPHRLLRSLSVSSAEPAPRPAAGVRQGRSQRQGQRLLLQREGGVTPGKTERACWSDVLGCAPTPHEAFWLGGSDVGVELLTWPWKSAGACWGHPRAENTNGGCQGGPLGTGRACQALSPLFFLQCRKLWFGKNQVTHPESDGIGVRRHKPYTHKTEPGLLDKPVKPTAQEEEAARLTNSSPA